MSSLKDIMDVDVEPLESQALRRSKEAASHQSQSSQTTSSATNSNPSPDGDCAGQPPLKRRRSNRVSKSSSQDASSQPSLSRRRSSGGTTESMESYGPLPGGNPPPSAGSSSRVSSRGSNPPESSVRYTPVTGRVSRAKKGQPVHICDLCDPPRIFTRAEHLRRHQLGHQKPAYPCTFEDCEKAFHRPDLLARHLNRHETQGEKAYKAGNSTRSRSSSVSTSITPPLKVETPMRVDTSIGTPMSTAESSTPYTSASTEGSKTATTSTATFDSIVPGFQAVNFTGERPSGQFDGSGHPSSHGRTPSGPTGTSASMDTAIANFPSTPVHGISQGPFIEMSEPALNHMYASQNTMYSQPSNGVPNLTLQVPDAQCPGLAFGSNNSPWYSSSESNWSTPSSRFGGAFPRDRSNSEATVADWNNNQPMPWSPGGNTIHTPRSAVLETVPERFESPPYLSPHLSPRIISYPLSAINSSPAGGYNMELVGTPTLSSPHKPLAQSLLSAPRTRSIRSKFTEFGARDIALVDAQHLDRNSSDLNAVQAEKVDHYITSYQTHLEPVYSIIHPETYAHHISGLARDAMAALGSQYHNTPEDRDYGSQLHESCMETIPSQSSDWDFQSMQAIFLTEIFARFRAKRSDICFSPQFVGMYKKLVDDGAADSVNLFTHLNSQSILLLFNAQVEKQRNAGLSMDRHVAIESIWKQWIDYEVRQRIRGACFALDVHQSICFEQSRIESGALDRIYVPHPCHRNLWKASSAQEWYTTIVSADYLKIRLTHPEQMSLDDIFALPLATQCVSLYAIVAMLPPSHQKHTSSLENPLTSSLMHKIATLFPKVMMASSYLALYLTPVRQLLALTGKTWVLNRKITNHAEMDALVPSIRKWTTEPASAQATWHACHVLHILLTDSTALHLASQWWCTYTATLIIWAFGHRATTVPNSGSERVSRRNSITSYSIEEVEAVNAAALIYLKSMLELQPEELFSAPRRSDTSAVIDAVRWKLEADAVPGGGRPRHGMLLDAVGVLQRLRDGGKWF